MQTDTNEVKIEIYDERYLFEAKGLINSGNYCWLLSLIQALMSCPLFNYTVFESNNRNLIISSFKELLTAQITDLDINPDFRFLYDTQIAAMSVKIIGAFQKKVNKLKLGFVDGSQDGAANGFIALLQAIDDQLIDSLFKIQIKRTFYCRQCGAKTDVYESNMILQINKLTPRAQNSEFWVRLTVRILRCTNYTCPKCNQINDEVLMSETLRKTGDILCVVVPKEMSKFTRLIELQMCEGDSDVVKKYTFKLVAQIEYRGDGENGHYTANVLRSGNEYHCDDSRVSRDAHIVDSPNTHMLFYHLIN